MINRISVTEHTKGFLRGRYSMIRLKRVYQEPADTDGKRVLVDRLWPRGISKKQLRLDCWMREVAPSAELRRWFGHKKEKWQEFARRYKQELRSPSRASYVKQLAGWASEGTVTLLFSARDEQHNQAVVLAEFLARHCGHDK